MVNTTKNPPWFRTASRCPYSGLAVSHLEMFVSQHPGSNYFVEIAKLGDRFLLIKGSGYARSYEMAESLAFIDAYVSKYFDAENTVFMIEDYGDIAGTDAEARRLYVLYHKNSPVITGGVFYNLSLLFRISANIGKRLHAGEKYLATATSYGQAIAIARQFVLDSRPEKKSQPDAATGIFTVFRKIQKNPLLLYQRLAKHVQIFSHSSALFSSLKIRRQNTSALLEYIASIDWHTEGVKDPDGKMFSDPLMKQAAMAVSYIKSEIDSLLKERDAAEKVLRQSEIRYRRLVEHAKAGIVEFDYKTHRIFSVNKAFLDICGYSESEITAMAPEDLMTPDSRKLFLDRMKLRMAGKLVSNDSVYAFFTKSGEKKWAVLTVNVVEGADRPQKADIIVIDITAIKTAEMRLMEHQDRLRALGMKLARTEARERRNLASRLHEGVSQELFAAQLMLAAMKKNLSTSSEKQHLEAVNAQIVQSIREIRGITHELSPPVLYTLGFPEALKSMAGVLESRHGLKITVDFEGESEDCNNEIKHSLYRVVREILQNIVKHARAECVSIFLEKTADDLFMEISDDGVGFDTSSFAENHYTGPGFGLFDIRERVENLGGNFRICSTPGKGTRVSVAVPLISE